MSLQRSPKSISSTTFHFENDAKHLKWHWESQQYRVLYGALPIEHHRRIHPSPNSLYLHWNHCTCLFVCVLNQPLCSSVGRNLIRCVCGEQRPKPANVVTLQLDCMLTYHVNSARYTSSWIFMLSVRVDMYSATGNSVHQSSITCSFFLFFLLRRCREGPTKSKQLESWIRLWFRFGNWHPFCNRWRSSYSVIARTSSLCAVRRRRRVVTMETVCVGAVWFAAPSTSIPYELHAHMFARNMRVLIFMYKWIMYYGVLVPHID